MARSTFAMFAAVLGVALALPADAQTQWKWRDKTGRTQYSDLPPPPSVPEQDILARPNSAKGRVIVLPQPASAASAAASAPLAVASAASSAFAPKTSDPELEAKRKKAEADQAAKVKAEEAKVAAARSENCARAKGQMRSLDSGVRIVRTNEKGEREFLDDKQRADETKHTRDVIAADCK
ncbi:MAG: DUF4124 domain-containing protein [Caldimonas sp.]